MKNMYLLLFVCVLLVTAFFLSYQKIRIKDLDCKDFSTQDQAQQEIEKGVDIYHLDADEDGQACETLPRPIPTLKKEEVIFIAPQNQPTPTSVPSNNPTVAPQPTTQPTIQDILDGVTDTVKGLLP